MSAVTDAVNANAVSSSSSSTSSTSGSAATAASSTGSEASFLKLLTTQLQNQDPTNPVDNAQLTSQIAQINTVSGINQLNTTVSSLSSQFLQLQAMQGTSLIGHAVTVPGNQMAISGASGSGGFSLDSDATDVTVKVKDATGSVVDTIDLGAQKAGQQTFTWTPKTTPQADGAYTFAVTAVNGSNDLVSTALMQDKVIAVNTGGDTLNLQLQRSGNTPYASVKTVN